MRLTSDRRRIMDWLCRQAVLPVDVAAEWFEISNNALEKKFRRLAKDGLIERHRAGAIVYFTPTIRTCRWLHLSPVWAKPLTGRALVHQLAAAYVLGRSGFDRLAAEELESRYGCYTECRYRPLDRSDVYFEQEGHNGAQPRLSLLRTDFSADWQLLWRNVLQDHANRADNPGYETLCRSGRFELVCVTHSQRHEDDLSEFLARKFLSTPLPLELRTAHVNELQSLLLRVKP